MRLNDEQKLELKAKIMADDYDEYTADWVLNEHLVDIYHSPLEFVEAYAEECCHIKGLAQLLNYVDADRLMADALDHKIEGLPMYKLSDGLYVECWGLDSWVI